MHDPMLSMLRQLSRALCSGVAASHVNAHQTIIGVQVLMNSMLTLELCYSKHDAVLFILSTLIMRAG